MAQLTLHLPPHVEQKLQEAAAAGKRSPTEEALRWLEEETRRRQRTQEDLDQLRKFRASNRLGILTDELLAQAKAERP